MDWQITQPFRLAALVVLPLLVYYWRRSLLSFSPWQRTVSLAIRVLLLVLLVVALCGVEVTTASRRQFVVLVVDHSASIPDESRHEAQTFVAEVMRQDGDNLAKVLPFAARPGPIIDPGDRLPRVDPRESDLAGAITRARAAVPQTCVPQIVLLSDGYQTVGDARAAAGTAAVPISVRPLPGQPNREICLSAVKPRVLLVRGRPESTPRLEAALKSDLIDVDVRLPQDVPQSLAELQDYDLLVLANVEGESLSARRLAVVQEFVSDLGGGLIAIGGDQSFTAGGYRTTALEDILPVFSNLNLAMVLVVDESGSMKEGGRIDLAKEAAKRTVDLLGPRDLLGVIGFGDESRWICAVQPCSDQQHKEFVRQQIDKITTSYVGTNLYPAVREAYLALKGTGADLKHMIVLTDATDLTAGRFKAADFEALTEEIVGAGVTLSTVAVGKGTDVELLQKLAEIRDQVHCYYRDDPTDLPAIFAEDIRKRIAAGRLGVIEKPFSPQLVDPTGVPPDFNLRQVPPLAGYVETIAKENSQVVLATQEENGYPLLAWWRCGRGLSVAFTSAAEGPWAEGWTEWPGFDRFWVQLVHYAMRKDAAKSFLLEAGWENGRVRVALDAFDRQGEYLNGAGGTLGFTDPEGNTGKTSFVQVAPGRYAADFPAATPGEYRLRATLRGGDRLLHDRPYGLLVRSAALHPTTTIHEELLRSIALAAGGQYNLQAAEVFASAKQTVLRTTPCWPYLLTAAVLIFLMDLALKRIDLRPGRS